MRQKKIFLITSGTYSNAEIISDFGLLPTSFLPIGHRRLFELQFELISNFDGEKYMTLPSNFNLSKRDLNLFEKNKVNIHRVNPNLSLSQSILNFIESFKSNIITNLFLLHGDTLFNKIDFHNNNNLIYYGKTDSFYKWGYLENFNKCIEKSNLKSVISGYFTFNNIPLLKEKLKSLISFEDALKSYEKINPFNFKESKDWLDFGHSNLYYKSKRNLNVTRSFNKTTIINNHIKKQSSNKNKIKSEFEWFNQFPSELKVYLPSVWNYTSTKLKSSYMIEFIGAPTLQEKFVFGNLPDFSYYTIIDSIFTFISHEKKYLQKKSSYKNFIFSMKDLYINKTNNRIASFLRLSNYDDKRVISINNKEYKCLNKFKEEVINDLNQFIYDLPNDSRLSLMHGDLCFSNILFDSRTNSLKLIDPRGDVSNEFDSSVKVFGDYRYDIAKLGHSLIGNYDHIVSGFYNLKCDMNNYQFQIDIKNKSSDDIKKYFHKKANLLGVSKDFIRASISNLFLSMLPLHNEDKDRQIAFLLNAYKIYYD